MSYRAVRLGLYMARRDFGRDLRYPSHNIGVTLASHCHTLTELQ